MSSQGNWHFSSLHSYTSQDLLQITAGTEPSINVTRSILSKVWQVDFWGVHGLMGNDAISPWSLGINHLLCHLLGDLIMLINNNQGVQIHLIQCKKTRHAMHTVCLLRCLITGLNSAGMLVWMMHLSPAIIINEYDMSLYSNRVVRASTDNPSIYQNFLKYQLHCMLQRMSAAT